MKAIKITREGRAPIHVPVERERQVYVGLTNLDDDVSFVAHYVNEIMQAWSL